jgi:hypothetical protein
VSDDFITNFFSLTGHPSSFRRDHLVHLAIVVLLQSPFHRLLAVARFSTSPTTTDSRFFPTSHNRPHFLAQLTIHHILKDALFT